ncbi:unnamed protein product [Orchesella dallaii]|uniref:F-box domain-containing protein n=1 Tax=Orchesella dallaii TaxID=48710 RepID=A0ABP1RQZ1_9HEXA
MKRANINADGVAEQKKKFQRLVDGDDKNPLMIDLVMKRVFSFIPFNGKDFKNYRLVCHLWLKDSLPRWRKEAWLHVRDGLRRQDNPSLILKDFLQMLNMPDDPHGLLGEKKFHKYKLSSAPGRTGFFSESSMTQFWDKVGASITHLKIMDTIVLHNNLLARVLFEMTPNLAFLSLGRNVYEEPQYRSIEDLEYFQDVQRTVEVMKPNLSEVQNNLTHFEINWGGIGRFGINWIYFFLRFPNIKSLKMQEIYENADGQDNVLMLLEPFLFEKSIRAVQEFGEQGCLSKLEHFDILNLKLTANKEFPHRAIRISLTTPALLTSLSLDVGWGKDSVPLLSAVLGHCQDTLKKLLLYRGPYAQKSVSNIFLPRSLMPDLVELRLIGPIVENLYFLSTFPNLKTLVIFDGQTQIETEVLHSYVEFTLQQLSQKEIPGKAFTDKINVIANTDFTNSRLRRLEMAHMREFIVGHELCNREQVKNLRKLMPALTKLRLGLGNSGFQVVCEKWNKLRHLDIEPFDVDEDGILGMENDEKYRHSNLTDLKELTTLRMGIHSTDSEKGRLTNASIIDGIFVAESLRNVSFQRVPKACKTVREMLNSKFPQ